MKNIFVGNLDFAATETSVRAMFERYGTVDRVNVVTDRDTGRSRGFGSDGPVVPGIGAHSRFQRSDGFSLVRCVADRSWLDLRAPKSMCYAMT